VKGTGKGEEGRREKREGKRRGEGRTRENGGKV